MIMDTKEYEKWEIDSIWDLLFWFMLKVLAPIVLWVNDAFIFLTYSKCDYCGRKCFGKRCIDFFEGDIVCKECYDKIK